jgi:membrane dipeptidase
VNERRCSRRDFLCAAGALALAPAPLASAAAAPPAGGPSPPTHPATRPEGGAGSASWPGYERALVLDFLASPGLFNVPVDPPLSEAMVRNAVASGITAVNLTVSGGGADAFAGTVAKIATWEGRIDARPDAFLRVRAVADLMRAKETKRLGVIYGFQDATPLGEEPERLALFHGLGVRIIQLTYNGRNLVGDGCLEPGNAGLSRFGRAVVERMNELGMIVDLAHCGERTTADAIAASKRPVAISHTGCRAVGDHPRSKRDEELRAMAEKGGVVGIYLMPFLTPGRAPRGADVVAHIEHALKVCGEEHVGIGSDLSITPIDGSAEYWRMHRDFVLARKKAGRAAPGEDENMLFYTEELNTPRRLERIAELLAARGHPSALIEKVIGGNFARLLGEVWGRPV